MVYFYIKLLLIFQLALNPSIANSATSTRQRQRTPIRAQPTNKTIASEKTNWISSSRMNNWTFELIDETWFGKKNNENTIELELSGYINSDPVLLHRNKNLYVWLADNQSYFAYFVREELFNQNMVIKGQWTRVNRTRPRPRNECGIPARKPTTDTLEYKLLGGIPGKIYSWPWHLMLYYENSTTKQQAYLCSGSLILPTWLQNGSTWIVTASSCFDILNQSDPKIFAYIGVDPRQDNVRNSSPYNITGIIKHPNYNPRTLENDIALLRLKESTPFTEKIRPLCFPNQIEIDSRIGMVLGWAQNVNDLNNVFAKILTQAQFPMQALTMCRDKDSNSLITNNRTQLCGGIRDDPPPGHVCIDDYGGALLSQNENQFALMGIASKGINICGGVGVYTKMSEFTEWVRNTIDDSVNT